MRLYIKQIFSEPISNWPAFNNNENCRQNFNILVWYDVKIIFLQ